MRYGPSVQVRLFLPFENGSSPRLLPFTYGPFLSGTDFLPFKYGTPVDKSLLSTMLETAHAKGGSAWAIVSIS